MEQTKDRCGKSYREHCLTPSHKGVCLTHRPVSTRGGK